MEIVSKEENFDWRIGMKIALKTLVGCFIGIMFAFCLIFVLFPKFSLKINNVLGFKNVKELNYQMIYDRSDKITDLYNLILYKAEMEDFDGELELIDEIISRDDYNEFCGALDKASLKSVSDKTMLPYSVNVNGYLMSRKVVCLYNTQKNGFETYIFRQTNTGKLSEYSYSTYVDLVCGDENLTNAQKSEKLTFLNEISSDIGGELTTLETLVQERVQNIIIKLGIETSAEKKISLQYALTRIYRSRYYAYEVLGDETKKLENKRLYEEAKTKLNGMIGL